MTRSFCREAVSSLFQEESFEPSTVGSFARSDFLSYHEPRSEGYDEYFDPPLESKYECPICLLGLREPVQTTCGHRFCKGCILRSIRVVGPRCPIDNEFLSEQQMYPDIFTKREMRVAIILCRLSKQHGCPWKGPLKESENHLGECEFVDISCPEKCGKRMQRRFLREHLNNECSVLVSCRYCHMEALRRSCLKEHYQDCQEFPNPCEWCGKENMAKDMNHLAECEFVDIDCPEKCGKRMQRRFLPEHFNNECPVFVSCGFCHMKPLRRIGLEEHYQDCRKFPKTCERCRKRNVRRDMMEEHFNKECPKTKISCPFHKCRVKSFRSEVNEHLITHLPELFEWVTAQDVHLRRLQSITDGLQMDQVTQGMQELTLEERGQEHQEKPLVKVIRELNILKEQMLADRLEIDVPHCNGSYIYSGEKTTASRCKMS